MLPVVAALDIGGTKLAAGHVVAGSAGEITKAVTPTVDPELCLSAIKSLLEPLVETADLLAVCSAGPFSPQGLPRPVNIPALRDVDLVAELQLWSGLPVSLLNDGQALALAEGAYGAAVDVDDFAVITVSTGIGGGFVVDGRLLGGATGNAGHFGHLPIDPYGPLCSCGRVGCAEALLSGTAIALRAGTTADHVPGEVIEAAGHLLGDALAGLVTLLDLRVVVLTGSVALGWGEPYRRIVEHALRSNAAFAYVEQADVRLSTLGLSGGLLGAALFALQSLDSAVQPV